MTREVTWFAQFQQHRARPPALQKWWDYMQEKYLNRQVQMNAQRKMDTLTLSNIL